MSQVPVKWVHKETPARFYTGNPRPSGLGTTEEQFVPVVPLSALREVVEGLKMIAKDHYEPPLYDEWLNDRRGPEVISEWLAQRLLASLGEIQ